MVILLNLSSGVLIPPLRGGVKIFSGWSYLIIIFFRGSYPPLRGGLNVSEAYKSIMSV